jgi:hypothetical protein
MSAEGGPKLPLLIYDGDCSFCRMWVDYVKCFTHDAISCAPSQQVGSAFPEIPLQDFKAAAQFVDESGHVSRAHAIFRAFSCAPCKRWMLGCYLHLHYLEQCPNRATADAGHRPRCINCEIPGASVSAGALRPYGAGLPRAGRDLPDRFPGIRSWLIRSTGLAGGRLLEDGAREYGVRAT